MVTQDVWEGCVDVETGLAVEAGADADFFHLFDAPTQVAAARNVATLLSPEPGSMIFGLNLGAPVAGGAPYTNSRGVQMYLHSPESWKVMWEDVFEDVPVKIEVYADEWVHFDVKLEGAIKLHWSIVRL